MKTIFISLMMLITIALNAQDKMFVHTTTAGNIIEDATYVDNPMTNGNPNAKIIISHVANPGGQLLVYNQNISGVYYSSSMGKWGIYNENMAPMEEGVSFTVYVADDAHSFKHIATEPGVYTELDFPGLNDNPEAIAVYTNTYTGERNDNNFQFVYGGGRWNIYNEDNTTIMPSETTFFVAIGGETGTMQFPHMVTQDNIHPMFDDSTILDHPLLNDNPNARFVFAHNWGAAGTTSNVDIDEVLSCWYENSSGRWHIFTEAEIPMPINATFNILIDTQSGMGVNDISSNSMTKAYPNPLVNQVNFESKEQIKSISIYNLLGQEVFKSNGNSNQMTVDLSSLPIGTYVAKIKTDKGAESIKLIKK